MMLRDIKLKILGLLGLLTISLALSPLSIVHAAPDVEAWERSIVRVYNNTQGGFGTGWVVSEDGIIATNHHVIAGGRDFSVYLAGSTQDDGIPARLIWSDERLDLALLRVPGFAAPPFKLHTDDPDRGTLSYTAGYPGMADAAAQGMSFRISIYSGTVSLVVNQGQSGRRIIQHDTIVNAGNSGGPLLDDCGRVLGVTSEGYADEDVNVVWLSVSISELAKQMDRLDIPYEVDNSVCTVAGASVGGGSTADQEARDTAEDAASTAEDAQHDVESLQKTMFSWVVILVAGLAILLVLVLRKPRERVVRAIEEMSRTISRSGKAKPDKKTSPQASARNSLVLSGFSSGGKTIHIELLYEKLEAAGKGISIGRSTTLSDYALDDKEVSRRHARLSMKDGRTYIEDLNSTNGTRVNERVINPFEVREISSGDMVKIGQLELTVS